MPTIFLSKSRGNLVFVSALRRAGVEPMAMRLALLAHHYRSDWQWDEADVSAAGARLDKWRAAVARGAGAPTHDLVTGVLTTLAEDLDAPTALRLVDHWANATDFGDDSEPGAGEVVRGLVDAALERRLATRLPVDAKS